MEVDRCRDLQPLYPAFAMDLLDEPARLRIQEHLQTPCAACAERVDRLQHAFHRLPYTWAAQEPPAGTAEVVVGAVARLPQEEREQPIVFVDENHQRLGWIVAALFALALFAAAWWGRAQLHAVEAAQLRVGAAEAQVERVLADYRSSAGQQAVLRRQVDLLSDPRPPVASLRGAVGSARVFLDPVGDRGLVFFTALPAGDWALWRKQGDGWSRLVAVDAPTQGGWFEFPQAGRTLGELVLAQGQGEPGEPSLR